MATPNNTPNYTMNDRFSNTTYRYNTNENRDSPLSSMFNRYTQIVDDYHNTMNTFLRQYGTIMDTMNYCMRNALHSNYSSSSSSNSNYANQYRYTPYTPYNRFSTRQSNQHQESNNNTNDTSNSNLYSTRNTMAYPSSTFRNSSMPFTSPTNPSNSRLRSVYTFNDNLQTNVTNTTRTRPRERYTYARPSQNINQRLYRTVSHITDDIINHLDLTPVIVRPNEQQIETGIERIRYNNTLNESTEPIDLTPFHANEEIVRIRHCGHLFRETNLREWFRTSVHCPLCRYDIREYSNQPSTLPQTSSEQRSGNDRNTNERISQYLTDENVYATYVYLSLIYPDLSLNISDVQSLMENSENDRTSRTDSSLLSRYRYRNTPTDNVNTNNNTDNISSDENENQTRNREDYNNVSSDTEISSDITYHIDNSDSDDVDIHSDDNISEI